MQLFKTSFFFAAFVASAYASAGDSGTTKESAKLVKYYTTWCGFCKKFAPDYDKVKEHYQGTNLEATEIDCDENREYCR